MSKKLIITEKPSVAMEFAKALKITTSRKNGYLESNDWIITWCVGHLVTMSYPEKYDEKLKFWRLDTLPFIPEEWKYEIIPQVQNQFNIVKQLLQREDVEEIYNAGDSGREGEYIQRLVFMMAKPNPKAKMKRVWIDSQTEEEILRGIREAKDMSEYSSLSDSAYLRAKEDYLIGINFSRLLSIIYGRKLAKDINQDRASISVGRVMTCVLGMVVSREREIRNFVKTKYYKIVGEFGEESSSFKADWKATEKSTIWESPKLYNETGFKKEKDAKDFIISLNGKKAIITELKKSKQKENAPLLFNLAEIQNECTKRFKINPYSIDDLLYVHGILTNGLIEESGKFRSGNEGVFDEDNNCIFIAPKPDLVMDLINDLFNYIKENKDKINPLILSSVFHYEFVFIHPFSDGNGRMARLWQNIILSHWKEVFVYLPIESLLKKYQKEYYKVIDDCNNSGESTEFIEFMLKMIDESLNNLLKNINSNTNEYVNKLLEVMDYNIPVSAKN